MASASPVTFYKRTFLPASASIFRGKIESVLDPFADLFDFVVEIALAPSVMLNRSAGGFLLRLC